MYINRLDLLFSLINFPHELPFKSTFILKENSFFSPSDSVFTVCWDCYNQVNFIIFSTPFKNNFIDPEFNRRSKANVQALLKIHSTPTYLV